MIFIAGFIFYVPSASYPMSTIVFLLRFFGIGLFEWFIFPGHYGVTIARRFVLTFVAYAIVASSKYVTLREEMWVWSQIYAEREKTDRLRRQNSEIKAKLVQVNLTPEQKDIVSQGKKEFVQTVGRQFHITSWKEITFVSRIGSGSFGDCYQAIYQEEQVAVKILRMGLIHKDGVATFRKEVLMLSQVHHTNIIRFVGFAMDMQLLIVMVCLGAQEKCALLHRLSMILIPPPVGVLCWRRSDFAY